MDEGFLVEARAARNRFVEAVGASARARTLARAFRADTGLEPSGCGTGRSDLSRDGAGPVMMAFRSWSGVVGAGAVGHPGANTVASSS